MDTFAPSSIRDDLVLLYSKICSIVVIMSVPYRQQSNNLKRNANPAQHHLSIELKGAIALMKDYPSVSKAFDQVILKHPGTS
jgi:hypothetical protein